MHIRKVLLVDADEDAQSVGGLSIQDVGRWALLTARSGADGLRIAKRERPGVVLLGETLSDMDAVALLREVRADDTVSQIPIIVLASATTPVKRAMQQYMPLGVCGIIRKPLSPLELPAQVRHHTGAEEGPPPEVFFRGR